MWQALTYRWKWVLIVAVGSSCFIPCSFGATLDANVPMHRGAKFTCHETQRVSRLASHISSVPGGLIDMTLFGQYIYAFNYNWSGGADRLGGEQSLIRMSINSRAKPKVIKLDAKSRHREPPPAGTFSLIPNGRSLYAINAKDELKKISLPNFKTVIKVIKFNNLIALKSEFGKSGSVLYIRSADVPGLGMLLAAFDVNNKKFIWRNTNYDFHDFVLDHKTHQIFAVGNKRGGSRQSRTKSWLLVISTKNGTVKNKIRLPHNGVGESIKILGHDLIVTEEDFAWNSKTAVDVIRINGLRTMAKKVLPSLPLIATDYKHKVLYVSYVYRKTDIFETLRVADLKEIGKAFCTSKTYGELVYDQRHDFLAVGPDEGNSHLMIIDARRLRD